MNDIINISSYKFVNLAKERLPVLRELFRSKTREWGLKGTILLSEEGINLFLAGTRDQIDTFGELLWGFPEFADMEFKESPSSDKPFTRMLVKIKQEIIAMGVPEVKPADYTAPHLSAEEFKKWYEQGKDMIVLDTRNDYEVRVGTFDDAIELDIKTFRDFPKAIEDLPEEYKDKPVVTFCTGGVRCEKATPVMMEAGFKEVYQLDGGILKYFEECGSDYYHGDCFVFDKRVAVDGELNETPTIQCFSCRNPLTQDQFDKIEDDVCPYCAKSIGGKRALDRNDDAMHVRGE